MPFTHRPEISLCLLPSRLLPLVKITVDVSLRLAGHCRQHSEHRCKRLNAARHSVQPRDSISSSSSSSSFRDRDRDSSYCFWARVGRMRCFWRAGSQLDEVLTTANRDLASRFFTAGLFSSHGLYFIVMLVSASLTFCDDGCAPPDSAAIRPLMRSFMVDRQSLEDIEYSWQKVNRANVPPGK